MTLKALSIQDSGIRTNSMVLGLVDLRTGMFTTGTMLKGGDKVKGNVILPMEASSCIGVRSSYTAVC